MINIIFSIPAATEPETVVHELYGYYEGDVWVKGAGYLTVIPSNGIMPASQNGNGKSIVHCLVHDATYQQILDVAKEQTPRWSVFGAIDYHPQDNPAYDPEIPPTITDPELGEIPNPDYEPPTIAIVYEKLNNSVWNHLPDRIIYDSEGNEIGTEPQTELHVFQGSVKWESRT